MRKIIEFARGHLPQFIRFCVIGLAGLLIILSLTHVGVVFFRMWYFLAYIIATLIGWSVIFVLNMLWTFRAAGHGGHARRYVTFLAGYLGVFCVNASLVYILTSVMGVHYLISISFAAGVGAVLSFLFSKHIIFHSDL